MSELEQEWKDMLRRSFNPTEWFLDGAEAGSGAEGGAEGEARGERHGGALPACPDATGRRGMWVYRLIRKVLRGQPEEFRYEVGFYSPDKEWHPDSNYATPEEAAYRTNWLNGGAGRVQPTR